MNGSDVASPRQDNRIRIALVESDLAIRAKFGCALLAADRFELWFETGSPQGATDWMDVCPKKGWPLIWLVDVNLPDSQGLAVIRHAIEHNSETLALAVSASLDEKTIVEAVQAGASGFVQRDIEAAQLVGILEQAIDSSASISPEVATSFLTSFKRAVSVGRDVSTWGEREKSILSLTAPHQGRSVALTPRERAVLDWLSKGYAYEDAAKRLQMSLNTFRHHVRGIYAKLGVHTRADAIHEARKRRWLHVTVP